MSKLKRLVVQPFIFLLLFSCSQVVDLDLPVYEPKLVLEFYLEDNKPLKCLLQESVNYTDTAFTALINNAVVILRHNGINDTLTNRIIFDRKEEKFYNYYHPRIVRLLPGVKYELFVRDKAGREMTGQTELLPVVPIDTQVFMLNAENMVSAGIVFKDDRSTRDYYRIVAFKDSTVYNQHLYRDFRIGDDLFNGQQFSYSSRFVYRPGDTIISRLYHLTQEHYDFLESVSNAQSANGNPFGQPANIRSNVTGGIGIFTTLTYDEKINIAVKE